MPFSVNSNILLRKIASLPVNFGQALTQDITRQYDLNSLVLRLHGTVEYSSAPSGVKSAGMAELLRRIDFFADGSKAIEEVTGPIAALGNFERRTKPLHNAAVAANDSAQTVNTYFRLDRVNADGPRPKDSALHTQLPFTSLLQTRVEIGQLSDVFTGGTLDSASLILDVIVEEQQEFSAEGQSEGRFIRRGSLQTLTVSASNSNEIVKLPVGALLRGCKIYARDENGDGADDVINNVQIRSAANVRMNIPWDVLRKKNLTDYGIPAANDVAGLAFADLVPNGRLNQLFDVRGSSELELVLDVSKPAGGNASVDIEVIEYLEQAPAG